MKKFKLLLFMLIALCFSICNANANNIESSPLGLDVQAIIAAKQGNHTKALTLINKAIKEDPKCCSYYNTRGVVKEMAEDYNGAISDYTTAIKLCPDYVKAYDNRGNLYRRMNNGILAAADLCMFATLQPSYDAYTSLGYLMINDTKNYKNAINYFTKAIGFIQPEIDRFNKKVAEGSAFGKIEMSQYEGAYYGRGLSYFFLKDSTKAIQDFNKAISYRAINPDAYYFRGLAKAYQGNKNEALKDLNISMNQYIQTKNEAGYNDTLEAINMVKRL